MNRGRFIFEGGDSVTGLRGSTLVRLIGLRRYGRPIGLRAVKGIKHKGHKATPD
jgi:hypothetical protein